MKDQAWLYLVSGIFATLIFASICSFLLTKTVKSASARATLANVNARIKSWWVMAAIVSIATYFGNYVTITLFFLLSFLALREFITLTPTRKSDHRVLFWIFFVFTPLQYVLVAIHWYGLFSIFIPVYAFVFIPIRKALTGDTTQFLSSTAKIQWGLLVCVYFLSHIPQLSALPIDNYNSQSGTLLLFFVITTQLSDVLQYVWGKLLGKTAIAPKLSPKKTWAGFWGGISSTVAIASLLWWATPFSPLQAAIMALIICLAGFAGGLVMSAIKRDLGAKDWGSSIAGHGGFMDRLDSMCFAAPLFFHLTGFYFGTGMNPSAASWILELMGKSSSCS